MVSERMKTNGRRVKEEEQKAEKTDCIRPLNWSFLLLVMFIIL